MSIYMISYDLNAPTTNRDKVEESIQSLGTWCKYLTTTYLVNTNSDISTIQSIISRHLDGNDRMIFCQIIKPIKGWLAQDEWDWINKNL